MVCRSAGVTGLLLSGSNRGCRIRITTCRREGVDVTGSAVQRTVIGGRSRFDQTEPTRPRSIRSAPATGLVLAGALEVGKSMLLPSGSRHRQGFQNEGAVTPLLGHGTANEISYHAALAWTPRPSLMIQTGTYVQQQRTTTTTTRFLETRTFTAGARRTEAADGSALMTSGDARVVWAASNDIGLDAGVRLARSTLTNQSTATPWLLGHWPLGRSWSLRAGAGLARRCRTSSR